MKARSAAPRCLEVLFGRRLGFAAVRRVVPQDEISVLIRRHPGEGSRRALKPPVPGSWTQPPDLRAVNVCLLSHPVYGRSLQQTPPPQLRTTLPVSTLDPRGDLSEEPAPWDASLCCPGLGPVVSTAPPTPPGAPSLLDDVRTPAGQFCPEPLSSLSGLLPPPMLRVLLPGRQVLAGPGWGFAYRGSPSSPPFTGWPF